MSIQGKENSTLTPPFPVVFDHIFKSAGTSVHQFFRNSFDNNFVPEKIDRAHYSDLFDHIKLGRVICAHLLTRPLDDILIANNYTVTILRDPVERLISLYHFIQTDFNAGSKFYLEAKTLSIEEFFWGRGEDSSRFHNTYQKHFLLAHTEYSPNISGQSAIALAREVMDRYAVVGIVPKMEEFLFLIAADLGIPAPTKAPRENVNKDRFHPVDVSSSLKERLREANAADYELYQYAESLYSKMLFHRLHRTSEMRNRGQEHLSPLGDVPIEIKTIKAHETVIEKDNAKIISSVIFQRNNWDDPIAIGGKVFVVLTFRVSLPVSTINPAFQISDSIGRIIYQSSLNDHGYQVALKGTGEYCFIATFENLLGVGEYFLGGGLFEGLTFQSRCWCWNNKLCSFSSAYSPGYESWHGVVALDPGLFFYPVKGEDDAVKVHVMDFQTVSGRYGRDVLTSAPEFPSTRTYTFMHQSLRSEVGALNADGIHSTSTAGYLIYGPYVAVLPGRYRVSFDLLTNGPQLETEITVDICAKGSQHIVMEPRKLQSREGTVESLDFTIDSAFQDLEIRLFVTEETNVIFKQYCLVHIF
jgi:hypothetical protein